MSLLSAHTLLKPHFCIGGHNPGILMFLQDGHNPHWFFFCNMDRPRPSQDVTVMYVTMVFRKI